MVASLRNTGGPAGAAEPGAAAGVVGTPVTGPLAPLFAQVRESVAMCSDWNAANEVLAALSSIERHVQDMAPVIEAAIRVDKSWGYLRDRNEAKKELRRTLAALPASGTPEGDAREKEEE